MGSSSSYSEERNPDPLGDTVLNYLIALDREDDFLDFKETLDISRSSAFPKLAKDIFAFANRGGGWIIIGFKQKSSGGAQGPPTDRNFIPVGYQNTMMLIKLAFNRSSTHIAVLPLV